MTAWFCARAARPLIGALGVAPIVPFLDKRRSHASCAEGPQFQTVTCTKNDLHTRDTRKITFQLPASCSHWTQNGPIANVVIRTGAGGQPESGCCACCKCPPPCTCPKTANGCCACCKCPGTCGCPKKQAAAAKAESGCCACCKCPAPCTCPKTANGCCACCKCPGTCGCPKKDAPAAATIARPYNPLSAGEAGTFTLLVKRYTDAKMGTALHNLKVGDTVDMRGPNQQWKFENGKYSHYAMIAGGTGITPLIQATEHILKNDASAKVSMVTMNKTDADILLKDDLVKLQIIFGSRLEIVHVTESQQGRPTAAMLKGLLPPPRDGVLVMVCGRKEMTADIAGPKTPDFKQGPVGGMLAALGYSDKQVWKV